MTNFSPISDFTDWLQTASGSVLQMRKAALSSAMDMMGRSRVSECSPEELAILRKALGISPGLTNTPVCPAVVPPPMTAPYGIAPFVGLAQPGTEYDLTVEATPAHPIVVEMAGRSIKVVAKA